MPPVGKIYPPGPAAAPRSRPSAASRRCAQFWPKLPRRKMYVPC
jgi:hypothetical protein